MPVDKVRDGDGGGKWTPGPWEAVFNGHYWQVNPKNKRPEDPWKIGDVCASEPNNAFSGLQEANARIIAAVPAMARELAAATAWMIDRQSDEYGPRENWPARERIEAQEAALALAEGGEP